MPALCAALDTSNIDELATSIAEMLASDDHTAVMRLRSGSDQPFWIDTPYGRHAVRLDTDEDGIQYELIEFVLSDDRVTVDIGGGTYGPMWGLRLYPEGR